MAQSGTGSTLLSETLAAARGALGLIIGERDVARYFDFSDRGVATSFIAVLAVFAIQLVLGMVAGTVPAGRITETTVQNVLLYLGILGGPWLLLRMLRRPDAFKPYLVAFNWFDAVSTVVSVVALLLGSGVLVLYVGLVAVLIVSINVGRIVMTLRPLQVVLLLVSQLVGVAIALLAIGLLFPPTPDELAQAGALLSNQPL